MSGRIWILLPAYNEEESLDRVLPSLASVFEASGREYRFVVVEDGSSDNTAAMLEAAAEKYPMDIVTHEINRGLGETERDGFEYVARHGAPSDVVIRLDCDDSHDPMYIDDLLTKMEEGYDVVNTSRFQDGGGQKGVNGYRTFISYGANYFMRILFGIRNVRDCTCGFRAYRVKVIQDAVELFGNGFIQLKGLGFTSTVETIVKLNILGCRFAEVPFVLRYDRKVSSSKMVSSITTLGYLTLALLYHWPFGGWRKHYKGLAESYRQSSEQAKKSFGEHSKRSSIPCRIGN